MLESIDARLLASLGKERLARLHRATVAVVGAGLLGGQLLLHLAMLQIRTRICEPDRVDPANLGNQLFPVEALGERKARARVLQMRALNPSCPVTVAATRVEDVGLGFFEGCDLILTGLDSRASRLAVNRIAQRLGIDWIDAAVDGSGERLLGTVSWFRPGLDENPCYACRYDAGQLAAIADESRSAGCASWRDPQVAPTPPTLAASPFGAVVAGMQMLWAMRALLGEGEALVSHQLQIAAGDAPSMRTVALARRRSCGYPHERLALRRVAAGTLGELLDAARADLGCAPQALGFPDHTLVLGAECPLGDSTRTLLKRPEACSDEDLHCACGSVMLPRGLSREIDAELARRHASLDWRALGLPGGELVSARAGARTAYYLLPPDAAGAGLAETA